MQATGTCAPPSLAAFLVFKSHHCLDCVESLCPASGQLYGHREQEGSRQECVCEDQVRDFTLIGRRMSVDRPHMQAWERVREDRVTTSRVGSCGRARGIAKASA